jgi:hypothetical protein
MPTAADRDDARGGAARLDLTQQLLAFARKQPLKPDKCNINALVAGFESVLRRAVDSSIAFAIELDPAMGTVSIDGSASRRRCSTWWSTPATPCRGRQAAAQDRRGRTGANEVGTLPAGRYAQVLVVDTARA